MTETSSISPSPTSLADDPEKDHAALWSQDTPGSGDEDTPSFHTPPGGNKRRRQPFRPVRTHPYDNNGNEIAGWGRRIGAFAIDWGLLAGIELTLLVVFGFSGIGKIGSYLDAAISIFYFTFSVGGPHGQTIGMNLTGICVIDEEAGEPPSYPKALLRFFLVSLFSSLAFIPLAIMGYFAMFDAKRQMVHDKAVGTVVIELAYEAPPGPDARRAPIPPAAPAPSPSPAAAPRKRNLREAAPIDAIVKFAKRYGLRITAVTAGLAMIATTAVVVANKISSTYAYNHSPARAATAYLTALSGKDVPALEASAGIVTPTDVAPGVNVLLSASDIARELAASHSATSRVSDVVVQSAHTTKSGTASVTLSYHSDNQVHSVTYSLISSDRTPSGWVVQVTPSRLDIDVPTGDTTVTIDGMKLTLDGQMAHAYLFPSVATVSVPASAIWQAASVTVDTRNQTPNGDPQQVSLPAQLLPSAQASAIHAVTNQINNCLAATSLTPANCPNNDIPESTSAGDTYSNIVWTGLGQPTAGMATTVDPSGAVTVWGSMAAEVSYTDTSNTDPWIGPISSPLTDGPTGYYFAYPLTWSGYGWTLGIVAVSNSPLQGQPSSTYSPSSA